MSIWSFLQGLFRGKSSPAPDPEPTHPYREGAAQEEEPPCPHFHCPIHGEVYWPMCTCGDWDDGPPDYGRCPIAAHWHPSPPEDSLAAHLVRCGWDPSHFQERPKWPPRKGK